METGNSTTLTKPDDKSPHFTKCPLPTLTPSPHWVSAPSFWPHINTSQQRTSPLRCRQQFGSEGSKYMFPGSRCLSSGNTETCCGTDPAFENSIGPTFPPQHSLRNIYLEVIMFTPAHASFEFCSRSLRNASEFGTRAMCASLLTTCCLCPRASSSVTPASSKETLSKKRQLQREAWMYTCARMNVKGEDS